MRIAEANAERLLFDFEQFLKDNYGLNISEAHQDPHFFSFLDHCVDRHWPKHFGDKGFPIRQSLVIRVSGLLIHLERTGTTFRLNTKSLEYARDLVDRYAPATKKAPAATPQEVKQLIESLDLRKPAARRLKAFILLQYQSWARPSELLHRWFPDDIRADYDEGIVITVVRSKTRSGPDPVYLAIEHDETEGLCAVCALRDWLEWLGSGYAGPLFPTTVRRKGKHARPITTSDLNEQIERVLPKCGLGSKAFTTYSFRRGPATAAAARKRSLGDIQAGLGHNDPVQSMGYIDPSALFSMMERILE